MNGRKVKVMTAKQLAEILLQTPDAKVVHEQYTGGNTPLLTIDAVKFVEKGEKITDDGGDVVDKKGKAVCDCVILGHIF